MVKRKSKHANPILRIAGGIVVVAVVGYLIYAANLYLGEEAEQHGILVCNDAGTECKLSVHIHAQLELSVCGEKLRLPLETGALDFPHTHKERNRIHLHDAIPFDPKTQTLADVTKLQLGTFFDQVGVRFQSTCLADKCDGDPCDGVPGKLTMRVNGQPETRYRDYVWSDGDVITLTYE